MVSDSFEQYFDLCMLPFFTVLNICNSPYDGVEIGVIILKFICPEVKCVLVCVCIIQEVCVCVSLSLSLSRSLSLSLCLIVC